MKRVIAAIHKEALEVGYRRLLPPRHQNEGVGKR